MRYIKYGAIGILCLIGIAVVPAAASELTRGNTFDFKSWGRALKEDSEKISVHTRNAEDVYVRGESAVVTNADIEKGTRFYMASGMEEAAARKKAIEYFEEFEAVYAEAVRQGYSVDEQEVEVYLDKMKSELFGNTTDEETQEQYREMIEQFDSEEDYWDYEKEVYRKQLPIEKLVNALEKEYLEQQPNGGETGWEEYFENYKASLVEEERFKRMNQ